MGVRRAPRVRAVGGAPSTGTSVAREGCRPARAGPEGTNTVSEHRSRTGRRPAGLLLGAAALALVTTSCAGGTSVGTPADDGPSAEAVDGTGDVGGDIRLAYWGSGPRIEVTDGVAALFTKAHPEVTVESEFADFGAYWQRLNVQATSGNMACVTQTQARQLNDYTTKGVFLDLDPMVESGAIDVSDIPTDVLDTGRGLDGKLYMLPYGAAHDAMMINKTMAEEAGVGLPPEGYDWPELIDWLTTAQASLPEGVKALNLGGGAPPYLLAYVTSQGEEVFDGNEIGFDEDLLVDYWTMWEDLRRAGITTTAEQKAEEPPQTEQSYIAQGRVLADDKPGNALTPAQATLDGSGSGQQLVTLPLPSGPGGSGTTSGTQGFSIPASCDNVPTAAAFIDFWMNDDEGAALFNSANGTVTNTRHLEQQMNDPDLPALKKRELELYQEVVELGPPTIVYPPGYQASFESAVTRAYETISLGGVSVEDAAAAFIEEVNAALAAW